MHKWNAQWDGMVAWQLHIFTSAEETLMKNRISSIKSVTVDTFKIKHNSYIIGDKTMYKIKKKMFFKYHKGGKELNKSDFSSFFINFIISSLLDVGRM